MIPKAEAWAFDRYKLFLRTDRNRSSVNPVDSWSTLRGSPRDSKTPYDAVHDASIRKVPPSSCLTRPISVSEGPMPGALRTSAFPALASSPMDAFPPWPGHLASRF